MKLTILLLLFFVGVIALASDASHDPNHIPLKAIGIQAVNFFGLLALLVYFLKKPIINLFSSRGEKYHAHLKVAQKAKDEAEKKKIEIKERLDALHATSGESVAQAKADAEEIRHQIIEDARHLSEKLEEEAHRTADYEVEKAKSMIREELITLAIKSSEEELKDNVNTEEQQRLQSEFVEKIRVVQQ